MKNRSEKRNARWLYKAGPKIFAPPQTPFPGARDGQNLISCMVTTITYRPCSLVRIDARNFELLW